MPREDVFETIARLRAEGARFAVVTVIRTEDATSAKPGDKAVVTAAGEILGHLGGGCVRRAVQAAAAEAIAGAAPRVLRVRPAERVVSLVDEDGAQVARSGCPSGGSVEMLVEGHAPPPRMVVLGDGAVARALGEAGALLGLRVERCAAPGAGFALDGLEPRDFVVIATQGAGDLPSLRAAALSPARFVGMVASRRKAAALRAKLVAEGVAAEALERVRSPVGLPLGALAPEEIAVSVAAEIVQERRAAGAPALRAEA